MRYNIPKGKRREKTKVPKIIILLLGDIGVFSLVA
jgi:hypothetical protein